MDSKWTGPGLYVPVLCVTNRDFVSPVVPFQSGPLSHIPWAADLPECCIVNPASKF